MFKNVWFMKNIQKNNIWIVENSYTDKMKILRKYWKIKKYWENVRSNKNIKMLEIVQKLTNLDLMYIKIRGKK